MEISNLEISFQDQAPNANEHIIIIITNYNLVKIIISINSLFKETKLFMVMEFN